MSTWRGARDGASGVLLLSAHAATGREYPRGPRLLTSVLFGDLVAGDVVLRVFGVVVLPAGAAFAAIYRLVERRSRRRRRFARGVAAWFFEHRFAGLARRSCSIRVAWAGEHAGRQDHREGDAYKQCQKDSAH